MIEALAVVVKVEDHQIWVAAGENSACGGCVQKSTCNTNVLGSTLKQKPVPVDSAIKLNVGDQVTVGIDENLLLRASLLLYLVPLIALFMGAGISDWFLAGFSQNIDLYNAISGFLSFLLSLWFINTTQKRMILKYYARPVVIKKH